MTAPAADNLRDRPWRFADEAADLLDAIDALHHPWTEHDGDGHVLRTTCYGCGQLWPCNTNRLLRPIINQQQQQGE